MLVYTSVSQTLGRGQTTGGAQDIRSTAPLRSLDSHLFILRCQIFHPTDTMRISGETAQVVLSNNVVH